MMKDRILRLLFPPKCEGCLQPLDWYTCERDTVLCQACLARLESERALTCDVCAGRMDQCSCMPPLISRAGAKGFYKLVKYYPNRTDYVQNRLLYTMKKQRAPRVHTFLARRLASALQPYQQMSEQKSLLITYLPRDRRTERKYGTDQARMLALALSKESGIPIKQLLSRSRGRREVQKKLSRKARISNAQRLFVLSEETDLRDTVVILVDDLVTTGASMAAGIRELKKAGAKHFVCIAVASDV